MCDNNKSSTDARLTILHEHYCDTFKHVREYWRLRNRLMAYTIVVLTLMFLQITAPDKAAQTIQDVAKLKLGIGITVDPRFIGTLLWIVLAVLVVPYFQYAILIDRQYKYLHHLEDKFKDFMGKKVITREGSAYLTGRPCFQHVVKHLYITVFPALLLLAICIQWATAVKPMSSWINIYFLIDTLIALIVIVAIILYMLWMHFKK